MHRVYGADGVLDATAIEMQVRKAVRTHSALRAAPTCLPDSPAMRLLCCLYTRVYVYTPICCLAAASTWTSSTVLLTCS
jgi:hypothetical protein